jgi:hypothetical protein
MNPLPNPPETDPLEESIRRAVAGLPARRAPATLEGRVLAAIAARGAPAGEARGFAAWPAPARWLGLPILAGVAAGVVAVLGGDSAAELLSKFGLPSFLGAGWDAFLFASRAVAAVAAMLTRAVPASWWYAALLAFAVWYAGVVGLGLTAYRLLRARE